MALDRLMKGTFILTAATFISKFLGMIYVFPFYALVGKQGSALYAYTYTSYTILLSITTLGVPLAVSKFVSKYNAIGDYETGRRMFRSGLKLMSLTGLAGFAFLFLLAETIAPLIVGNDPVGNSVEDVAYAIRMVSFALILVPAMSIFRGFFQGYQFMNPTAVSQVLEQIIRITFILLSCWIIIRVLDGDVTTAVGYSTFAAFVGAMGAMLTLLWYWFKRKEELKPQVPENVQASEISLTVMYKELFLYALPFVYVGLSIPLYQLVDTFTFNRAMMAAGHDKTMAESAFTMINFANHKLIMIPVSLATAFALTLVPAVTSAFASQNYSLLKKQIMQTIQVILLLVLPAVVGLSILAYPAYGMFFDLESVELGGFILRWYAPVAVLFALFTVTSAILQGLNLQRYAVVGLSAGVLVKVLLNIPLIHWFDSLGAVIATALGFTCAVAINFMIIKRSTKISFDLLYKRGLLIFIFVIAMAIIVTVSKWLLSIPINFLDGRFSSMLVFLISVAIGAVFYLWLTIKSGLFQAVIGKRKGLKQE